mmetsp:Transcript_100171/g.289216  ORF Transcript_100171/g.289216 Transcript_100171/m.289216 type:complete len:252 (+) Transcript_100171:49-804(+)
MSHGRSYISSGPPLAACAAAIQFGEEGSSVARYTATNAQVQARKWLKRATASNNVVKAKTALVTPKLICHSRAMRKMLLIRKRRAKRTNRSAGNSILVRNARLGNNDSTSVAACRFKYMQANIGNRFSRVPGRLSDGCAVTIVMIMSMTVKKSNTRFHQNNLGGLADPAKVTSYGTTKAMMRSMNQATTFQVSLKRDSLGSNGSHRERGFSHCSDRFGPLDSFPCAPVLPIVFMFSVMSGWASGFGIINVR